MTYRIGFIHSRRLVTSRFVRGVVLVCFLILTSHVLANDCGVIEHHNYPTTWKLPATAIDTDIIPDVELDPDAPDSKPLPVYKLIDNTYFLFGNISILDKKNRGFNANAGFIVTEDGVIVIDTLGTPKLGRRMVSTIRCVTHKPIKYLIVTHNHPDHAYGTAAFRGIEGITIITHPGTLDYNHSDTLQTSVDYRKQVLSKDMDSFHPLEADIYLQVKPFENKRISLGNEIFDIYNVGMHHSYGDIVVHQVNSQILWIADLAFNQRTTFMGDGDSAQILKAQDWLLQTFTNIRLMVPGHGSVQTAPFPMVTKTHDYVTRMRDAMQKAVEDGISMLDAVQDVEFEDWQNARLYESNQRANANFVYLEMEKAFFEND